MDEVANCHCEIELTVTDGEYEFNGVDREPPTSGEVLEWATTKATAKHLREHAAEFGLDIASATDRRKYDELLSDVIDSYDYVVYSTNVGGQHHNECAVFLKDDVFGVVNLDGCHRVTMFRYDERRTGIYARIWNQVRK